MKSSTRTAALAVLLAVSGCGHGADKRMATPTVSGWRNVATAADRERIRTWRMGWMQALAQVATAGEAVKLGSQGALLQPDAALPDPTPPPGDYACSVIKLGSREAGRPAYAASRSFACRIAMEHDVLSFAKLDGAQRPVGLLFPGNDLRMIFLGTMMLGDERRALDYGRDPERDMAGAFERVGPKRWRLVLPFPRWESTLDVIELTPRA